MEGKSRRPPRYRGGLVALPQRFVYHRPVIPPRERLLQMARLVGSDIFAERFGPPRLVGEPDIDALRTLIEERLHHIAQTLVEEATASDDVTDAASGEAYLEDRLRTLADLLTPQQSERLREAFRERTAGWSTRLTPSRPAP